MQIETALSRPSARLDKAPPRMCFSRAFQPTFACNSTERPTCTATAPIPAARSARATSAQTVRLSGWCHRIRDHGGVLFIDLRDHYGLTQVRGRSRSARPSRMPRSCARNGWCGSTARCASARPAPRIRNCRPAWSRCSSTEIEVLGPAGELPMPVFGDQEYPEEIRLQISLPRSAPRAAAQQHHEARPDHRFDPRAA